MEEYTVEQGVKAIVALQAYVGEKEPEDVARVAWERFSDAEKQKTAKAYEVIFGEKL